jgi:hypothetical protein
MSNRSTVTVSSKKLPKNQQVTALIKTVKPKSGGARTKITTRVSNESNQSRPKQTLTKKKLLASRERLRDLVNLINHEFNKYSQWVDTVYPANYSKRRHST